MITEATAAKIALAVLKYAITQKGVQDAVRKKLGRDPARLAFRRALQKAATDLERKYPTWVASLFDVSFFEHEGAPILARLLLRGQNPDPTELATKWASAINIRSDRRVALVREIEPVAADFLQDLATALMAEREFSDLHDSKAIDELVESLNAIRQRVGADEATPGTRWDYLRWLIGRNLYLDPRGTFQTQRQVQLKLDEIYISLKAQREGTPGSEDRRLREKELAELEIKLADSSLAPEEIEEQRDQLIILLDSQRNVVLEDQGGGVPSELAHVVSQHQQLVMLGDPGSGKTTLVRHLALEHAQAMWEGRTEVDSDLGSTRFPILLRISNYAEQGIWRNKSLSDFLLQYHHMHECPTGGLASLFSDELSRGNCLILLDGLDEITSADERRGVVNRIEDFARRYVDLGNRFVVTSRIAGYRTAPLEWPFVHFAVQEMDEPQVERFLDRWCHAVEAAETPDAPPEEQDAVARREMEGILSAVRTSPGVARLATNPLLLRILALIYRTGAQLPQKRVHLYKLAADTLGQTWRVAHGVPESALIDDVYLTRLLSTLSYWLHLHKPTGIATEHEVQSVLGEAWAKIHGLKWNADDPDPSIHRQVENFLSIVRVQTGLFVERAPKRYGFMHLTFEEYYVARHLVARPKTRAQLIRKHLHDPGWDEPILLALGFVGLDYPDDASDLFAAAILAEDEDNEDQTFEPSPEEGLLGRDYLFALRCLADEIPTTPGRARALVERLVNELLFQAGSGRFLRYRQALQKSVEAFRGTLSSKILNECLMRVVRDDDVNNRLTVVRYVGSIAPDPILEASPVSGILLTALQDSDPSVRAAVVQEIVPWFATEIPTEVANILVDALGDSEASVRTSAATALAMVNEVPPEAVPALVDALGDSEESVRVTAASLLLGRVGEARTEALRVLVDALEESAASEERVGYTAASVLRRVREAPPELAQALVKNLQSGSSYMEMLAVRSMRESTQLFAATVPVLMDALGDSEASMRASAASALGQLSQLPPKAVHALVDALGDSEASVRASAETALRQMSEVPPEAVPVLVNALGDSEASVRVTAATLVLERVEEARTATVPVLVDALGDSEASMRASAATALGRLSELPPEAVPVLVNALGDSEPSVRVTAVQTLTKGGLRTSRIIDALVNEVQDASPLNRDVALSSFVGLEDRSEVAALLIERIGVRGLATAIEGIRSGTKLNVAKMFLQIPELHAVGQRAALDVLKEGEGYVQRMEAADFLGRFAQADELTVQRLFEGLIDLDNDVRETCAKAVAQLGKRYTDSQELIKQRLLDAIDDPEFDATDHIKRRSGHDYAYDGLWMLMVRENTPAEAVG